MRKPRAVIFDMDGVLTDSEWFIAEAGCLMFKENHGIEAVHEDFLPFVGQGEKRFLGGVAEKYGLTGFNTEKDKARTFEIYVEIIKGKLQPMPGAVDFVRRCRELGIKTALATSTDRIKMTANLQAIGLVDARTETVAGNDAFDAMVNGLDVERQKPFPDIYLEAASRIETDPADCWVVEDSVSGVRAAKSAGMNCLGLLTTFPEEAIRNAGADRIAKDLSAIRPEDLSV
jgi:beta-phosphoglucomutase-like phosphatase (HAD superfamily)